MSSDDGFLDPYKSTIIKLVVKQVMAALVVRLPFLSLGPVSYVLSWALGWIFEIALDKTILGINLAVVDITVNSETSQLRTLLDDIKKLPPDDTVKREEIEDEIIKVARDLIRLRDTVKL